MNFIHHRNIVTLAILLLDFFAIIGQKQNEITGEFIVRVKSEKSIQQIKNFILQPRVSGAQTAIIYQQIMKEPFNLWLIKDKGQKSSDDYFIDNLRNHPEVISIQKNRYLTPRVTPNDPDINKQWQYSNDGSAGGLAGADLEMAKAWDLSTGGLTMNGDTIVVCVIDDGVNGMHPDMAENMWINHLEIPSNGIDDDGNGYIDDYRGWNIVSRTDNVWSGGSHGTPVAGVIGAVGNNGKGVSGINWNVKLMPVNYGVASEASALSAYEYAYVQRKLYNNTKGKKGAFIVVTNASWGVDDLKSEDAPLWCALFDSLGSIGVLNCGATANVNTDVDINGDMPTNCESEYLISVTNLMRSDIKQNKAGYGKKSIDLGAYGDNIYTVTRNDYGTFGGTSGATPHVAGVIALIYATKCDIFHQLAKSDPSKVALVVKDMILHGTVPNQSLNGITTTNGRLNAYRSIKNITSLCEPCSPPAGLVFSSGDQSFRVTWANDEGSSKVILRYRQSDGSNWTEIKDVVDGTTINGLKPCTEYEIQTGSDCGLLSGAYSYSKYIKTSGCCSMPVLEPIITFKNSIKLNWKGDDDATFKLSLIDASGKKIDSLLNQKSFSIDRVPECTAYTVKIQAFCKKYNNESLIAPEILVGTSCGSCTDSYYCPIGKKDASQEWIESFTINNKTNSSGNSKTGYRDFLGINNLVLDAGKSYDFFIKPGYASTPFSDFYKIYLDLNQNGIWTANELMYQSESVRDSVKGTLKIPVQAVQGFTKMRVIMSYERFDGACDHLDFEFGEVEDYCVFINNQRTCINRADIKLLTLEKNKVVLLNNYFLQGARDSLKLQYRVKNGRDWINISGRDTITIRNLEECTLYEFRYNISCDTLLSEYSTIDTFRTACKNNTEITTTFFSIQPNPASDFLEIKSSEILENASYQISDITGRTHYPNQHLIDKTIKLENLTSGVYVLTIITPKGIRYRHKFIKI